MHSILLTWFAHLNIVTYMAHAVYVITLHAVAFWCYNMMHFI